MNEFTKMQALEKKLNRGVLLEEACLQLGIEVCKAKEYLESKKELDDFNRIADGMWGRTVAKDAIDNLKEIIADDLDAETRRRACKDLLDFYRDERKRLELKVEEKSKLASIRVQADLFDVTDNPWTFPSEDS